MKVKYPEEFFSFKNGVEIDDVQINKWIEECFDKGYSAIGSGNTMVIIKKLDYKTDGYNYKIMVCKNYEAKYL